MRRTGPTTVVGELEDDFHHFGVQIDHDDTEITAIAADAERRMDVVADEALMEKTLGKDWRKILRGDPPEKEEL